MNKIEDIKARFSEQHKKNDGWVTQIDDDIQYLLGVIDRIRKIAHEYESVSLSQRQVWAILQIIEEASHD